MYQVMCMSFDGEIKIETPGFKTIEEAADYDNNLGSKWFFYPFHFIVSGKTIRDCDNRLSCLKGKRIKTVQNIYKAANDFCLKNNITCDPEEFLLYL